MPAQENNQDPDPGFLASHQTREATSFAPWIVAGVVVIVGIGALAFLGGRGSHQTETGGTGMAPADAYAANLPISNLQMSEATSFSGAKVTYIDGQIANNGNQT